MSKDDIFKTIMALRQQMMNHVDLPLYDLYSDTHIVKELPPYSDVITNMIISSAGVIHLLSGYIIYGKFVYDSLFSHNPAIIINACQPIETNHKNTQENYMTSRVMLQKYASSHRETNNYFEYIINSIIVRIDKKKCNNYGEIIKNISQNNDISGPDVVALDKTCEHFICMQLSNIDEHMRHINSSESENIIQCNNKILVHQLCHIELICRFQHDKNIDVNNILEYDCIRRVLFEPKSVCEFINNFSLCGDAISSCGDQHIKKRLINIVFETCMYLRNYKLMQYFMHTDGSFIPPNQLYFDAVKNKKIDYFKMINSHNNGDMGTSLQLDIINENGLTPLEIAIICSKTDPSYMEIITELNKRYVRNPKYWSILTGTEIYDETPSSTNEFELIKQIKNKKTFDVDTVSLFEKNTGVICDVIKLNNKILEYFLKQDDLNYVELFIKKYLDWLDLRIFFDNVIKYNSINIFLKLYRQLIDLSGSEGSIKNLVIEYIVKLHRYDLLLQIKDNIKDKKSMQRILKTIIELFDYRGLIFIAEYFGNITLATEFDGSDILVVTPHTYSQKYTITNRDTIMHLLCKIFPVNESNLIDMQNCFKVLKHYAPFLINAKNESGYPPIYEACNNQMMLELLIMSGAIITYQELPNPLMHHIIQNGSIDVLKKFLLYFGELINEKNKANDTPIILAGKLRKANMCNLLLHYRANTSISDNDGNLLEHYISLGGLADVEYKPLETISNNFGYSPQDYLAIHVMNELVK